MGALSAVSMPTKVSYPVARYVIENYAFQMRDVAKYIRVLNISFPRNYNFERKFNSATYSFCCRMIVPIMIGLQMYDLNKYKKFIEGNNFSELDFLLEIKDLSYWLNRYLFKDSEAIDTTEQKRRLSQAYDALFKVNVSQVDQKIGCLYIDNNIRDVMKEIVSLLSSMSYYED